MRPIFYTLSTRRQIVKKKNGTQINGGIEAFAKEITPSCLGTSYGSVDKCVIAFAVACLGWGKVPDLGAAPKAASIAANAGSGIVWL